MIRYRLDDLGWFQFEWLCQSLLKAIFNLQIEAWGGHSDWGRDAYYKNSLFLNKTKKATKGPFIFQSKFIEEANAAGARSYANLDRAIRLEMTRTLNRKRRSQITNSGCYVLLTNCPVSAVERKKIQNLIFEHLPKWKVLIWGASDLCCMLDNTPNIRVAFPQLLGLRDINELLRSVVNSAIRERSTLSLSRASELAPVFVPVSAYSRALQVLSEHFFVVLTGPPEVGKTTIARTIGLAKYGEGWECVECRSPEDILKMPRKEAPQIFIADDAFGTTEYRPDISQAWAAELDSIIRTLGEKRWLIWTSRPAPLHMAMEKMHLQGKAEKFPQPGEVLVDASELTRDERALILYRHAKHAGLTNEAKMIVREHAAMIINNKHFTPQRASRFVSEALPKLIQQGASAEAIGFAIKREIEEPTASMKKSFEALDSNHQDVLIAMLDAGQGVVFKTALNEAIQRFSTSDVNVDRAIENLSSHFLHADN